MINARDAYRKSIINSKAKSYIDELEKLSIKPFLQVLFGYNINQHGSIGTEIFDE